MKAETKKKLKTAVLITAAVLMIIGFSRLLEFLYSLVFSWLF
jgi:hypothetical protein